MESSRAAGTPRPASIATVLDAALAARPEAPAVEADSGVWSYAELNEQAQRAAGALWSLGVRPGDRVAACLPNDLPIVAAFYGAQRIGAIWAGIGEALAASEQDDLVGRCAPKVVLGGANCRIGMPSITPEHWSALVRTATAAPRVPQDGTAPAAIAFTSGTSGRPKAVVHSQRNLLLPGAALVATRGWGPRLRKGDSFPLTILNLLILSTLLTAQAGGCAVLTNRRDADGVADWLAERRVTVWNGAPAQLYDLARRPHLNPASLHEVWSGGSDTPDSVRTAFTAAHGVPVRATYGLTEAPAVVAIDPVGEQWRAGASGRVLPHYDVAAYDDAGIRLPPGELGELRLGAASSGPWAHTWTPAPGCWESGGLRPFDPGPFPTGDIGTVSADGWLSVLDRKKLVILRGGANVYPLEVERVIGKHPAIAKVAVCPAPDERLGQRVAALVETTTVTPDFEAIATACRAELAGYKVPEIWARVEALPVNAMGKVERTRLPEMLTRASAVRLPSGGHR
ncbi:class I adenylate-forming enzyme family protein [Nocardia sp. NPDC048505]|uniref:class I adenylate-forming enzyme family protein n=1 Tax=unclassified Nocardia TaxID=2637762 RepID=UPI0033D7AEB5